ncbi:tetratricopeptide repeat-containing sensor histidine kinase [Flavobacterium faecale]|nr:tetratricopeptide repeat protein [Flavobacterium faecale]
MKNSLVIILLLLSKLLFSQTKIDSLERLLPNTVALEKVKLLNELSFAYWNVAPVKGLQYANIAYALAVEENSKADIAKSLQSRGVNYWAKSEFNLALDNYQKSLKLFEEINDLDAISALCSNLGAVYLDINDYENALKYNYRSLKISKEHGFTDTYIIATNNISSIYLAQKNYPKALEYLQEVIAVSGKQSKPNNLASQLNSMGEIYKLQKEYKKAKGSYEEALKLFRETKSSYGTAICLYNIGDTEYRLKNYASAIEYLEESLTLSNTIHDQLGILLANQIMGLVHKAQQHYDSALSYYNKAFQLAIELGAGAKAEKLELYKNYADLHKSTGKLDKSIFYLENYISLKDSINSANSSKQISEMQTKYGSEKKEKENELLRKNSEIQNLAIAKQTNLRNSFIGISLLVILMIIILFNRFTIKKKANQLLIIKNEVISNQRDELKEINSTKDKFFSIISHDLKSPFTNILGFTDLLIEDYDSFDDDQKKEIIVALNKSSQSAFNLLSNLLTWAQSQTGRIKINKKLLNLEELVETSIAPYEYNASAKNIEIITTIPSEVNLLIDRNSAMIAIGNLVNNAIKFTPNGGKINLNYDTGQNNIMLHIKDTGIGMTAEIIGKLFKIEENISTKGTNNEEGTGLGLILSKEFINKNGGDITVKSELGKGSEFIISFPK